jgi:hypothetical protein
MGQHLIINIKDTCETCSDYFSIITSHVHSFLIVLVYSIIFSSSLLFVIMKSILYIHTHFFLFLFRKVTVFYFPWKFYYIKGLNVLCILNLFNSNSHFISKKWKQVDVCYSTEKTVHILRCFFTFCFIFYVLKFWSKTQISNELLYNFYHFQYVSNKIFNKKELILFPIL